MDVRFHDAVTSGSSFSTNAFRSRVTTPADGAKVAPATTIGVRVRVCPRAPADVFPVVVRGTPRLTTEYPLR